MGTTCDNSESTTRQLLRAPTEIPNKFTSFSSISGIGKTGITKGIVFDSLDEIENALHRFESGNLGEGTTKHLVLDTARKNPMGAGFMVEAMDSLNIGGNIIEEIMKDAKEKDFGSGASVNKKFEYDGLGTNFFKTRVTIEMTDDGKYLLGISQSYEDKGEADLRSAIKGHSALCNPGVTVIYHPVDEWYFNIDLGSYERALDTNRNGMKRVANALLNGYKQMLAEDTTDQSKTAGARNHIRRILPSLFGGHVWGSIKDNAGRPEISMTYKGDKYIVSMGIDDEKVLRTTRLPDWSEKLMFKVNGTAISGASWGLNYNPSNVADVVDPTALKLRIRRDSDPPTGHYNGIVLGDPAQIARVLEFRDELLRRITAEQRF